MLSLKRIFPKRNRPVRSKSRWRKTLERRNSPHQIVQADRKNPFMTLMVFPKSEEERSQIEARNLMMAAIMGTAALPGALKAAQ